MGDYAGNWRYGQATDRRQAGTTPTKRPRRDYGMWSLSVAVVLSFVFSPLHVKD